MIYSLSAVKHQPAIPFLFVFGRIFGRIMLFCAALMTITDDVDGERAADRSQLVANQARVVAVVGEVRIDQSNRVLGVVSLNLQHHYRFDVTLTSRFHVR